MDAATARVDGALLAPRLARPALAVAAGVDLALLRALVVACVASVSSSAHVIASIKRRRYSWLLHRSARPATTVSGADVGCGATKASAAPIKASSPIATRLIVAVR